LDSSYSYSKKSSRRKKREWDTAEGVPISQKERTNAWGEEHPSPNFAEKTSGTVGF